MKYFKKLSFLIVIILLTGGCEEYLDKAPESGITDKQIFTNYNNFRGFNDQLYNYLRDYHDWKPRFTIGSLADLEECGLDWQDVNTVNNGNYYNKAWNVIVGWMVGGGTKAPDRASPAANAFKALRIANLTIENIDQLKDATQQEKDHLLGQAYFFRAWYHFELIRRYGGMPYFDKVFTPDMNMDVPRLTYRESTNRIVEDCEKAVELLP